MVKANAIGCAPTNSTVPSGNGSIFSPLVYGSAAAASTLVARDSSLNSFFNNVGMAYATVATAGSTSTLTVASAPQIKYTGTSNQTVVLPAVSTFAQAGFAFEFYNASTGSITVQSSGANTVKVMEANSWAKFTANAITGTNASVWDVLYLDLGDVANAITTIAGDSGTATGSTVNIVGGATGLDFAAATDTVTLEGTLSASHGGTGLTSPGSAGNVLTSNGTAWVSSAPSASGVTYTSISSAPTTAANTVYMATAALTVTLPSAPADGYLVGLINASSGTVLFQASGTDIIQISSATSTAAGTATSTIKGESMMLVYQASGGIWFAPAAPQGASWDLA